MNQRSANPRNTESAEAVAIEALSFIAGDPELLSRFLAITGIEPSQVRQAAREPGFLAGVLDFVMAHEPTVLAFAEQSGVDPATLHKVRQSLPFGAQDYDFST